MFTSAIGEKSVRQGKEPDFSEPRDPLMQRVQPLSRRHFYLGAAGSGCHFMCSKLHEKISVLEKELKKKKNQVPLPFCSITKISSVKQFPAQLSCQAVGAALVSVGSSWVPHSWKPHQRHHLSIWACLLEPCSPAPQLGARRAPMENRGSCSIGTEQAASPTTEPGSVFVNTLRLPGLECDFFGDLHLFESCPQGFPRIPFHLAEAQCSFSSFLV